MLIELTSEEALREWLPKLVGVERSPRIELADGSFVGAVAEGGHEAQLTRTEMTSTVHYLRFEFTPAQVDAFQAGPVVLAVRHRSYDESAVLSADSVRELVQDLKG